MPNNFNSIAWAYDSLAGLVFGKAIKNSQLDLISFIPDNSFILITGGGTGWIIEEIGKSHSSGLEIIYLDSSEEMILRAKSRYAGQNKITFIHSTIESINLNSFSFDVIFTPFIFDLFPQVKFEGMFDKINGSLRKGGLWLYADFNLSKKKRLWQKILLKIMYMFFRIVCDIETNHLPMVEDKFRSFTLLKERNYFREFIKSAAFRK